MQKPTKLQQTELQQLKLIQEKNQAILLEFGQIELIKLEIESRIDNAKAYLKELREEERTLAEFLESTYGKGSIDLDKGEFIALE
jgi:3-methyladenine DNA glycosylase Tag